MEWRKHLPWRHRKAMRENTRIEAARTEDVRENVVKPLREKRELFEHNHLAEDAARGLGIIIRLGA